MPTLTFLAACLTAAALFGSRLGRGLPNRLHRLAPAAEFPARAAETAHARTETPADDRGITLQTLIVTAVLVLMAVAAGVVIVAITTSSSDDLEESGTDVEARCSSVEIYDPEVASRNELGIHEGTNFQGSAIGCIPVCVLTNLPNPFRPIITAKLLGFRRASSPLQSFPIHEYERRLPREQLETVDRVLGRDAEMPIPFLLASGEVEDGLVRIHVALLADDPAKIMSLRTQWDRPITDSGLTSFPIAIDSRIDRIAVAPNQNECLAYDSAGEPILP